ncbi:MAG: GntR family transcriptional regulator [Solirubrobacteraceae bacterium]
MTTELDRSSPARPATAADRAYAYVKERLLDGRYAGGTLLSENEVARQLGISRTPVRHAFSQLESEDLLELYPRRGALVRPISATEAQDVLEARLLIETHCAVSAATSGSAPATALNAALAKQETIVRDGGRDFTLADREFHHAIVAAHGNAILTRQHDALRDRQQRITAASLARDPALVADFLADHRAIASAIERGNAELVAELITAHIALAQRLAHRPRS